MQLRGEMPTLDGATGWINGNATKSDLLGLPTIFHVWSISCQTCKKDMPKFNQLVGHYGDKINVISIHMPRSDQDKNVEDVKNAAKKYGVKEPIYLDHDLILTPKLKIKYVPAYFVFDDNGKLRHVQSGGGGFTLLQGRIRRVIGG